VDFSVTVENIKCGGCVSGIESKLMKLACVEQVEVDLEAAEVKGKMSEDVLETIESTLSTMGYPPVGTQQGLEALGSKAKSFVSCAIGTLNKEK